MEMYVGMDVHSKECVYAVQDPDGRLVGEGRLQTSYDGLEGLRDRYRLPAGTRVAMETGEMAFVVAKWLMLLDLVPVVVDAREVRMKAYRPSQKSDRRDALELCEGLRRGQYRGIVHVPPREIQKLRGLLSHRRHFARIKTRQVNAAKQVVRVAGLGHLVASLDTDEAWQKFRKRLDFAPDLQDLVECHYFGWLNAQEQMGWLEVRIDDLQQQHFAEPAKKLLRVLWAMLRTGEEFDLGRLGIEEGDFKKVVRKKYRLKPTHAPRHACQAQAG